MKGLAAGDVNAAVAVQDLGSEGAEGVLGVVAGEDGFGERGGAGGLQAGEEDRGLDLGGGKWGCRSR